jgi:hypothetical protein
MLSGCRSGTIDKIKKIKVMKLIRRFTCGLTGDDCVIIDYGDGVEICELYSTYLDLK